MWESIEKKNYKQYKITLTDYECSIIGETLEDLINLKTGLDVNLPISNNELHILVTLKEAFRNLGNHKVMEVIETGINVENIS